MNLRKAAIVLGAGASRGARLAGGRTPPLDTDFLDVAARHFAAKRARGKGQVAVKAWNDFRGALKHAGLDLATVRSWRLEQLSTFLEARANLRGLQLGPGRPRNYAKALETLKVVVCHVLQAEGGTRPCVLHRRFFELTEPSAVISFNYDLIADQSLLGLDLLNWSSAEYCCDDVALVPRVAARDAWQTVPKRRFSISVPLLKLHGSMHYEETKSRARFRLSGVAFPAADGSVFRYLKVPKAPYLIPPVAAKIDIRQSELRKRWYSALHHLHDSPSWIIWGYSFPQTDTISQVLFRAALARNRKPKPVIVINPDMSVGTRVLDVCRKVKVQQYPSMERFLMDNGAIGIRRT